MLGRQFLTKSHQTTNGCGSSIKNRDFILGNKLPPTVGSRVTVCALEQNSGRSIHERTINGITMSCHPTYIGCTPKNVFRFDIKDKLGSGISTNGIASLHMLNTLGFPCTTTCIKDVENILTIHYLTRNDSIHGYIFQQFVKVEIASLLHGNIQTCAPHNERLLDHWCLG